MGKHAMWWVKKNQKRDEVERMEQRHGNAMEIEKQAVIKEPPPMV